MVRCQKCGQDNDSDADFCEYCGANFKHTLNGSGKPVKEGMKPSTKILIAVCILLVAALVVTAGVLLQVKQPVVTSTNTTNVTVNSSVNQSQSGQNSSNEKSSQRITSSQAANIALKYGKKAAPNGEWSVGSVDFVPASNYMNTANYMVELSNNGPVMSGVARAMDVRINAQTGAIMQ
jgi:hypothetical protein